MVIHHVEVQVLLLLLIASFVGMGARRLRLPYTLALVVAGLLLGFIEIEALHGLELTKDLLLLLFLPALLFEAALHVDPRELRRELPLVLTLAVPGVLLATASTAALLYAGLNLTGLVAGFTWPVAFLMASVIAATDPISVLALFKDLGVTRRLYLLVEGESLLNDGVAVVVFVIVAAVVGVDAGHGGHVELHGTAEIAAYGLKTFLWMAGGGAIVGLVVGGGVSALLRGIDDHLIETTLTTLVAYGSFLLAEELHTSGVLATVCAGIVTGSLGREWGMSVSTRVAMEDFWEYAAFLANSFIFLLVGLQLDPATLVRSGLAIAVAFVAVAAGRALVVYTGVPLARWLGGVSIPGRWQHVMWWGGLRGSLSMVLILALPSEFAGRAILIPLVFGVVALSLFGQGLSMPLLLRRLGLSGAGEPRLAYEGARLEALTAGEALSALEKLKSHRHVDGPAYRQIRAHYERVFSGADARAEALADGTHVDEEILETLAELVEVEREQVRHALHAGLVSPQVATEHSRLLDERHEAIVHALHGDPAHRDEAIERLLGAPAEE